MWMIYFIRLESVQGNSYRHAIIYYIMIIMTWIHTMSESLSVHTSTWKWLCVCVCETVWHRLLSGTHFRLKTSKLGIACPTGDKSHAPSWEKADFWGQVKVKVRVIYLFILSSILYYICLSSSFCLTISHPSSSFCPSLILSFLLNREYTLVYAQK